VLADEELAALVQKTFDFRPRAIIEKLNLRRPVYLETARHGHFGRNLATFTWEHADMADKLRAAVKGKHKACAPKCCSCS
jgi:S-adenosylmethionine synthetase